MPSVDLKSEYRLNKKGDKSYQEGTVLVLQDKDQEQVKEWGAVEGAVWEETGPVPVREITVCVRIAEQKYPINKASPVSIWSVPNANHK